MQESIHAVREGEDRLARLTAAITEFVPRWSMAPLVEAFQAVRGINLVSAVSFLVEVGDLRRFDNPRQLMGYLGLVPSERSTGDSIKRGGITKAGNTRARRTLVESAWTYRHPPRVGKMKLYQMQRVPAGVREIAWKAQSRLTARYRALMTRGKRNTVAVTAVARELAAFLWAIAREVAPA